MTKKTPLWKFLQVFARAGLGTLFDLQVYGKENVPSEGGALLAANHQSYLDPVIVAAPLRRPVSFLAKSELFENKYLAWLIRNLHAFPIRQGKGDRAAITETVNRLKEGHLLNMYPEGTRSGTAEIEPLQPGIGLIIRQAKVPIVPTVLDGSFQAWPRDRKLFRPHPIRIMYGPPMFLHELPAKEGVATLEWTLRLMLKDLRAFPAGAKGEPVSASVNPVKSSGMKVL